MGWLERDIFGNQLEFEYLHKDLDRLMLLVIMGYIELFVSEDNLDFILFLELIFEEANLYYPGVRYLLFVYFKLCWQQAKLGLYA